MNCRHWDTKAGGICREPAADKVRDAERANLCDWFIFADGERGEAGSDRKARDAAERLFK